MTPIPENTPAKVSGERKKSRVEKQNDLRQAKRLLQVESSLERVRVKALQMKGSDELKEVIAIIFKELGKLGFDLYDTNIAIVDKTNNDITFLGSGLGGVNMTPVFRVPYLPGKEPYFDQVYEDIKKRKSFRSTILEGKRLRDYHKFTLNKTDFKNAPKEYLDERLSVEKVVLSYATMSKGFLEVASDDILDGDKINILKRFARVVDLTYTRFVDLQKAEAQSRESQIQLALERVRARTMAMQHSDELSETASIFFKQMISLGIETNRLYIGLFNDDSGIMEAWATTEDGSTISSEFFLDSKKNYSVKKMYEGWKEQKKSISIDMQGKELSDYIRYISKEVHVPVTTGYSQHRRVQDIAYFSKGLIGLASPEPQPDENVDLLERFAKVFDQTYTRFLDLKKAEAQAREAQIEAALERVRSRSIAMRRSEEIADIAAKIFGELRQLDLALNRVLIWTFNDADKYTNWWSANPEVESTAESYRIDYNKHTVFINYLNAWQQRKPIHLFTLSGDTKKSWEDHLFEHTEMSRLPMAVRKGMREEGTLFTVSVISDYGLMMSGSFEPLSDASIDIIQRFGRVFQQSYTRFLDLQKAEAQSRESQIQLALERVRARTMAMQHSDELSETASIFFKQMISLGIETNRLYIGLFNDDSGIMEAWATTEDGSTISSEFFLDSKKNYSVKKMYEGWKEQKKSISIDMQGKELSDYIRYISKEVHVPVTTGYSQHRRVQDIAYFSKGLIGLASPEPQPDENVDLLERFAKVFDQTYTRFLDLKKAEAQAREAQIEAALERIRAAAMAMHSSEDVSDATSVMFSQLDELGVETIRCGVALFKTESKSMEAWASAKSSNKRILQVTGKIDMTIHPLLESLYDAWKSKKPVHRYDLRGDYLRSYYKAITEKSGFNLPTDNLPSKQTANSFFFPEGSLYAFTEKPLEGENEEIFKRFTKVFTLTYRRYLDLIVAEVRTREAIKQSSLDRVRGEIASMRTAKDLERITPLIWQELVSLDVPFIRCGVFLMNEEKRIIDNYLSTPDGKAIAAFQLPYDTPGFVSDVLSHWQKNQIFIEHWDTRAMAEFADVLVNQGIFSSPDQYLKTLPKEGFYLHFLPFLQGMLYVGNMEQLNTDAIDLLQSLADAFSTAYARYDDFNRLDLAKKQIEKTLVDLKQTQQQLIQSEKMASLGELTAGIAHEIQNPLNFVNNFSELNKELLIELEEAILKGDFEEIKSIAKDVFNNQEKINHHGQRAEGIVKGMLQHSRTSTGEKELTDINALSDEYLRLAYHGMRAKDKNFNAEFKTNLDADLPKIKVISQDIGRVLLNLINNAFQAVSEKAKNIPQYPEGEVYTPVVTVSTKTIPLPGGNRGGLREVQISIKDNGPGIPDEIKDKIFQPFFTTKPTGSGTGLGLSLSYDIVKVHGGKLYVESIENKGTEFIVEIPVN